MPNAKTIVIILLLINVLFIPLYIGGLYLQSEHGIDIVLHMFNVDGEANVIAWYSSALLLLSALCLFGLSRRAKRKVEKYAWLSLSIVFALFSLDETAELHEVFGHHLGEAIKTVFSITTGSYAWLLAGIPLVLGIFFLWKKCLRSAMPRNARYIFCMGITFYLLALLGELIAMFLFKSGTISLTEIVLEDFFELTGSVLLLYSFFITLKHKRFKNSDSRE